MRLLLHLRTLLRTNMLNVLIRTLALLLLVGRFLYWEIEKSKTERLLPKTKRKQSFVEIISLIFSWFIFFLICLQVLGVVVFFPFLVSSWIQAIGAGIVGGGTWICISARKTLAENWVSGEEYQIKNNQKLITKGIYGVIRHPIYVGLALSFIGGELVASSWLFISFFAYFIVAYIQGKREEKILLAHFGKEYKDYMQHTKMLIPYIL